MPPKKAAATKFVIAARGEGRWLPQGGSEEEGGALRIAVDADLAKVAFHVGPDFLEEWNPAPLGACSLRYLRGGSHVHVAFELLEPVGWRGEVQLSADGLAGRFEIIGNGVQGKMTGAVTVDAERDHAFEAPRPTAVLVEKLRADPPRTVDWQAPECCAEGGSVLFLGIGGPSRSGKSSLARSLADRLRQMGRHASVVAQSDYERSVGSYRCSAGVDEAMYEHPSAVDWPGLARALSKAMELAAAEGTAEAPAVVVLEGSLALWMPAICRPMYARLFLRASHAEVLRRRQASAPLAEPFVEHVFWPMHLQYGQPQVAPWEDLRIEDESADFPPPDELLAEAFSALGIAQAEKAEVAEEA